MNTIVILCLAVAATSSAASLGHFDFAYDVPNSHSHSQTADGDVVKGHYSVLGADGMKRTVHYTADAKMGFVAHVEPSEEHHEEVTQVLMNEEEVVTTEKHDEGSDDGSYHEEHTDEVTQGEGADDGSYHEEHSHHIGEEEGKYRHVRENGNDGQDHGQYNPVALVPVPLGPRYILPQEKGVYLKSGYPYTGFPYGYPYSTHYPYTANYPYYRHGFGFPYTHPSFPFGYYRY